MDLSVNPLPDKQRNFLKSGGGLFSKNINKSQYRTDIVNHLDESIKYLYHILPNSHLLKKDQVYDKINAQTLDFALQNTLKDIDNENISNKFDFRTIEIARMFFEISKQYLEQNPILKIRGDLTEETKRSLQSISDSYYLLANTALEKEGNKTITIKNEKRMRDSLERLKKSKEDLVYRDKKYTNLEQEKRKLQDKASKLDQEWTEKSRSIDELVKSANTKAIKIIQGEMEYLKEREKEINQKVIKIQDKQRKLLKPILEEVDKIWKELGRKYNHLEPYFSLKNSLSEFTYTYSPHKPEKEQTHGL